jgi:hypothetical protein
MLIADIGELRAEAQEARRFASTFQNPMAIADFLRYAAALEFGADCWEETLRRPEAA